MQRSTDNIKEANIKETPTNFHSPFFMRHPLDMSKANWEIYLSNKEPRAFTEQQFKANKTYFKELFPDEPSNVLIICHKEQLSIRFVVKGTWANEKRCYISNNPHYQPTKYMDLRLNTYKYLLESESCLQPHTTTLAKMIDVIEDHKPIKLDGNHPLSYAIKAALSAHPDHLEETFNRAYQEHAERLETERKNKEAAERALKEKLEQERLNAEKMKNIEPPFDFMNELKIILIKAHHNQAREFSRHTGLTKVYQLLTTNPQDDVLYKAVQKETTLRTTGFQNWISQASFFCIAPGRDPAVNALYQYIANTSPANKNQQQGKAILANLAQLFPKTVKTAAVKQQQTNIG